MPDGSWCRLDKSHPFYAAWMRMHSRCYNRNRDGYEYYGGKGIIVEVRWHRFDNFRQDMLSTWFSGACLDRKDGNKNYYADNCRWVTDLESKRNKSNIVMGIDKANKAKELLATGKSQAAVARLLGVSRQVIWRIAHGETWNG